MTAASDPGTSVHEASETWVAVGPASALRPGEMKLVDTGKAELVVVNIEGEYFAFDAICTHALGYLDEGELRGHQVVCPLHEGCFDVRTGAVLDGPPEEPLSVYEVSVVDGTVRVRVPG